MAFGRTSDVPINAAAGSDSPAGAAGGAAGGGVGAAISIAQRSLGLAAEVKAFLDEDAKQLELNTFTLAFRSKAVEAEYLIDVANRRWPVLIFIFCFDVLAYAFRTAAKLIRSGNSSQVLREVAPQLLNMAALYLTLSMLNRRSCRQGHVAAKQEELLLGCIIAAAVCFLFTTLTADNASDYVLIAFFLIATTTFLKLRWHIGSALLALPVAVVWLHAGWIARAGGVSILPPDALVHITMAWGVGALLGYVAESYRRQMVANHRLATRAAEKDILEIRVRIQAQKDLAEAQQQAAARALCVAREKAANEAKSDFMSLMCHEVRTPLNGALASVEMLLETPLEHEQRELAKTIRVSGSILLSTVSNFLDFFKIEAGKQLDIVRTEIEVAQLVGDVHCIIEAMIGRSETLSLQRPELVNVPNSVLGDPDRLCGILLNLYTNAAKFTRKGFIALRVRVAGGEFVPSPSTAAALYSERQQWLSGEQRLSSEQPPGGAQVEPPCCEDGQCQGGGAASAGGGPAGGEGGADDMSSWPGLCVHSGKREDGRPVWERKYSVEDNVRVRRRHSVDACNRRTSAAGSTGGGGGEESPSRRSSSLEYARDRAPGAPSDSAAPAAAHAPSPADLEARFLGSSSGLPASRQRPHRANGDTHAQGRASWDPGCSMRRRAAAHVDTAPGASADDASASDTDVLGPLPGGAAAAAAAGMDADADAAGWASVVSEHSGGVSAAPAAGPGGGPQRWLVFEVVDSGAGISPDGLRQLFKQYEQGDEVELRKPRARGGTGLGLSICSKQVAVLGGKIGVLSKQGTGSIFWFTIPLELPAPGQARTAGLGRATTSGGQQAARAALRPSLRRPSLADEPLAERSARPSAHPSAVGQPAAAAGAVPTAGTGSVAQVSPLPTADHAPTDGGGGGGGSAAASPFGTPGAGSVLPPPTAPGPRAAAWQYDSATKVWTISARRSLERRAAIDTTSLQGRCVLLAEDNLINQTVARKMLQGLGLQCVVACDGVEAVDAVRGAAVRGAPFDVVLMDMMMPSMGGVEATKVLRAEGFTLPIVAMTANASDKDRDECLAAGMDGFLSKPVLKDRLAEAIDAAISGQGCFSDKTMAHDMFDGLTDAA